MKYNLLGQLGIAGERNPDMSLSDDVATYMYDFPPGQGNNKGASSKNKPVDVKACLLYTSPSPRDKRQSRMPSSA